MGIEDHPRRREDEDDDRGFTDPTLIEVPPRLRKYERRITSSVMAIFHYGRREGTSSPARGGDGAEA